MKKQAKMKSAVITSIIAMLLSVAMLFGTTFAWFTDSVTNTNNIIKSGNLDIELSHSNTVGYDESIGEVVKADTKLFLNTAGEQVLWEPGVKTDETFRIQNMGSLALKYEFRIKPVYKTLTEDDKKLLDVLSIEAKSDNLDKTYNFDNCTIEGTLLAGESVDYYIAIVWNPSEKDNDYNVVGGLSLLIGIELVATQNTIEKDGFNGDSYDKDAEFPNLSTYIDVDKTSNQEVVLKTNGENAVSASVPASIINALPAEITSICLAHTEPIEKAGEVYFEAIKLVDQNGFIIDLEKLGANEEVTVTLPAQNVFAEGETVAIYHDGEFVDMATVGANGVIAYSTSHFSKVEVKEVSKWDGTTDTSWYNDTDTEFTLATAAQIVGLTELVDGGNTFEGKTIKLDKDLDLLVIGENGEPICFDPIGSYRNDTAFMGTFDGQGHTISNLSQNTWALNNGYYYGDLGLGLFGKVEDATIKNVNVDNASISGESAICGIIAGTAYGDCTFENIKVTNSKGNDYQYYAGGVVGWASGKHVYKNIVIDESTVIGSQWGDFGNCNGGIIGGCGSSASITFEDCTVACRIDATNDIVSAYQWYCYRNSGMLIGNTGHTATDDAVTNAAAPNVTCKNVTVIYGDWANYTYCEFAGTGYPYVRVQAGVSVEAYSNVRYGHPTDANGNVVVDDNHVHNEGEAHHELIVFDQLFGGRADHRYCQYGIATHPGVTVIYNNK